MEEIKQLDQQEAEQIFKLPNSWREKGKKEGILEGILKGIQEGRNEGKMEEKKQIALEMLKERLSDELIAKVTKLSRNDIEELKKTI